ncbi:heavy-metal-associated domain-containing protein [Arthrobacter sp. UM1]|uniref:heavy-metal-associated domain-containing protein n=1 Tax=Arthrobacter sp. UM1 TaxID=2766776 RepID=UPI001CF6278B|nr:heavy-metal-associated domain-containing protein [Arthrobacter sp. UM1]MCB4209117.1 heavy-metal-associated domain-containing protein [Arthrobacter sp. UM1]
MNATPESTTVLVEGMTCSHCVNAVTDELRALEGVESVQVELKAGAASEVRIASTRPLSSAEVSEAVAEAGYSVVGQD